MSFLLDTDTCSAYLRGNGTVFNRMIQHSGGLFISVASVGELYTWVLRHNSPPRRLQGLMDLLIDVSMIDADHGIARQFGETEAYLLDHGLPVSEFDLLIAATALVHNFTLVTHNTHDFRNIPGLRLDDWVT